MLGTRVGEATNPGLVGSEDAGLAAALMSVLQQFQSKTSARAAGAKPLLTTILSQCFKVALKQQWGDAQVAERLIEKIQQHAAVGESLNGSLGKQSFYSTSPRRTVGLSEPKKTPPPPQQGFGQGNGKGTLGKVWMLAPAGAKCGVRFAAQELGEGATLTQIKKALDEGTAQPGNLVLTRDRAVLSELQTI